MLGTTLQADGKMGKALSRQLACSWADFQQLTKLWSFTHVRISHKLYIFQVVITSRALYGLSGAWLSAAEQRRLDSFQARCLWRIF